MKFSLTLAVVLFPAVLVNAQSDSSTGTRSRSFPSSTSISRNSSGTSSAPSASPSSAAPPGNSTQVNVQVFPGDQLVYSPSNFTAKNGTIVTFTFPNSSTPHSVTQGDFAKPCTYLTASGGSPAGFDSGLLSGRQFSLNITNDKDPIYFFCKSRGHCGLGMVGAINAPTTGNTYAAYLAGAMALGTSEPVISNTGPASGGVGATAVSSRPVSSGATTSRSSSSGTARSSTPRSGASGTSSAPRYSASG